MKRQEREQHIIGEPRAVKVACVVRRGADGTGPAMAPRQPPTLLRACVQRHGYVPQHVVVDRGPEFQSVYFDHLLASCGCHKKDRPASSPRFGSVIERLFGTTNTQFI